MRSWTAYRALLAFSFCSIFPFLFLSFLPVELILGLSKELELILFLKGPSRASRASPPSRIEALDIIDCVRTMDWLGTLRLASLGAAFVALLTSFNASSKDSSSFNFSNSEGEDAGTVFGCSFRSLRAASTWSSKSSTALRHSRCLGDGEARHALTDNKGHIVT